jgi:thiol-disulfide isomerase/thioredoxin
MNIGDTLHPFQLLGAFDKTVSTEDIDGRTTLIIFTCNHCPYARAYVDRIARIREQIPESEMFIAAINANDAEKYPEDSFENMAAMSRELGLGNHYLWDETQLVAETYGAQRTPEVFLFDHEGILQDHGAIDDNWENEEEVIEHYLIEAIEAVLQGQSPEITETDAVGCSIKWKM